MDKKDEVLPHYFILFLFLHFYFYKRKQNGFY